MMLWFVTLIDYKEVSYEKKVIKKKKSCGYTIISNGKGVDCNGDTITLVKNPPHGWKRLN